jgi:dynein intermediate chain 3, axonemal
VGELSLCKVCCSGNLTTAVSNDSTLAGDVRSHLLVSTEEGDVIFADLCGKRTVEPSHGKDEKDKEEEEEVDNSRDYVRWITRDHSRPCVALHQSPFFPDVLLSVGDWNFHIWRVSHVTDYSFTVFFRIFLQLYEDFSTVSFLIFLFTCTLSLSFRLTAF